MLRSPDPRIPYVEILQGDLHPDGRGFTWWLPPSPAPSPADAFNAALAQAGLPPADKAARLLLGAATVVAGSPATDPVPDPALPHTGALTWGDPAAELPAAIPPPGRRPLIFLYGGKPRYVPGMTMWADSAIVASATNSSPARCRPTSSRSTTPPGRHWPGEPT